jgi:hypothetical protein
MSTAALAPSTITMQIPGGLATSSEVSVRMPFSGSVTGITAAVTTAPVGSALTASVENLSKVATTATSTMGTISIAAAALSAAGTLGSGALAVTNKALTSNVATLTTAAHGYAVGDKVEISGVGIPFDGPATITVVGSSTTFSYARTAANVSSVSSSGGTATSKSVVNFSAGDVLSLDVTAVGSSTAGSNIAVLLTLTEG